MFAGNRVLDDAQGTSTIIIEHVLECFGRVWRVCRSGLQTPARHGYQLAGPAQTGSKVPKSVLSGPDPSES